MQLSEVEFSSPPRAFFGGVIEGFNRPAQQIGFDNLLGFPTQVIGDQDRTSALEVGIIKADD